MTDPQTISPVSCILIDVDDTIYPTSEVLPQGFYASLDALSKFIGCANEGACPPIGFCTGRELSYIVGATRSLTPPDAWSILENGNYLYNLATRARINHPLLTEEVESAFQAIRYQIPHITHRFPVLELYVGKEVNIALERRSPQIDLADYIAPVREMLSEFDAFIDITHSGHALDIIPKGINKGSGMVEMCKVTGITPEQILSIGDSPNDFPVMEAVGFVGCPANASEACKELVKRKGGQTSSYRYVVGVVDTITRHISIAKQS